MIDLITTADGTRFAGFPNDHLFSLIKGGNLFVDGYVKDAIDHYVKPDSVCVDVGANLGYVSLYMASRSNLVHAFEPQPVVFLQLCANLFLNQRFNVRPYNIALNSCSCPLDFAEFQSGWVGTHDFSDYSKITSIGSISLAPKAGGTMASQRLDSVLKDRVDFIKVDAQGADIDVVLGAEGLLKAYRPVVIFEYEADLSQTNYGRQLTDLFPFLDRMDYSMKEVYRGNFLLTPN